ncbi:DUF397 domain-containing protein [Actinomadura algeriensis]|uniref:DUF397 domain-containing protein n=1 Tax=Actinomadura algeriensis TaxID=1679523 RepID=A0ABR9JSZ0_9ACTN|nr:DUF397 domain-containing protein [Actinomadura algeriensis]MBE1533678.1 hypothetical protein [Actinomadura algeriensis]
MSNTNWRKANKSGENGGACVEVASVVNVVAVRDSKDPDGSKLVVSRRDFRRFTEVIKTL